MSYDGNVAMLAEAPRVLIVDDDEIDRELVRRVLKKSGLTIQLFEAADGPTALALWDVEPFDCVLLDYQMHIMNGVELFKELSSRSFDTPIAAIFLTCHGSEALALELIGAGAFDFVSKTDLTPSALRRAIQYALARRQHTEQLHQLANNDGLTGLTNRSLYGNLLEQSIARRQRANQSTAVLFLDLDNFKAVNDTLGHAAGDKILVEAARRLENTCRSCDTVSRFGGDEFAVLAQIADGGEDAAALADRIAREFERPFEVDGQDWFLGITAGISVAPSDGDTVAELMKKADLALYKAKAEHRGRYCFFTDDLNMQAQKKRSFELALRASVRNEEFSLYYQPQIDLSTRRVTGAEALIRWCSPDHGLTMPDAFIPFAEATRLILPIGDWVLRHACLQCAAWHANGLDDLSVAVNLSPVQLQESSIVGRVRDALAAANLDPAFLEIEVTETAAMEDSQSIVSTLKDLADLGVRIAIDDFGTGYSSLARLKDLPFQKLKIDRVLTADLANESVGAPIVDMVIALGKHMNLSVVAEGVEDGETLDCLRFMGCNEVQGHHLSEPMPSEQFSAWCRTWADTAACALA